MQGISRRPDIAQYRCLGWHGAGKAGPSLCVQQKLKAALVIRGHAQSVLAGAIGAALWGAFRVRKLARSGVSFSSGAPT